MLFFLCFICYSLLFALHFIWSYLYCIILYALNTLLSVHLCLVCLIVFLCVNFFAGSTTFLFFVCYLLVFVLLVYRIDYSGSTYIHYILIALIGLFWGIVTRERIVSVYIF